MSLERKPWVSLRWHFLLAFVIIPSLTGTGCGRRGPPYTPKEALQTIRVEKGFRVELFASEPLISSPVAMELDENGRIFVVEMPVEDWLGYAGRLCDFFRGGGMITERREKLLGLLFLLRSQMLPGLHAVQDALLPLRWQAAEVL